MKQDDIQGQKKLEEFLPRKVIPPETIILGGQKQQKQQPQQDDKKSIMNFFRKNQQDDDDFFDQLFMKGPQNQSKKASKTRNVTNDEDNLPLNNKELINELKDTIKNYNFENQESKKFSAIEDIYLILGLALQEAKTFSPATFNALKQQGYAQHNRTPESLRDRYKRYLRILTDKNIRDIIDTINTRQNVHGLYLNITSTQEGHKYIGTGTIEQNNQQIKCKGFENLFEGDDPLEFLNQKESVKKIEWNDDSEISLENSESYQIQQEKEVSSIQQIQQSEINNRSMTFQQTQETPQFTQIVVENPNMQIEPQIQKPKQLEPKKRSSPHQQDVNSISQTPTRSINHEKEVSDSSCKKISHHNLILSFQQQNLNIFTQSIQIEPQIKNEEIPDCIISLEYSSNIRSFESQCDTKELYKELMKFYNLDEQTLDQYMYWVSGDLKDLDILIANKNSWVKWTEEEDEILKSIKSKDNNCLKMLRRYKRDDERIEKRIEFLGMKFPFEFP